MEHARQKALELAAYKIRLKALEMIRHANSGHIGGSYSIAEILAVLYFDALRVDPSRPRMPDRDRLILSKGHCAPALYAALAMRGFFPEKELMGFRTIDGSLSGHAEMNHAPGVDMSTGSLGQGLSVGVGMALCAKTYGHSYRTCVILGDGEVQEGQVWEAVMAARQFRLDNLIAIVDLNGLQLDGATKDIMDLSPLADKLRAFGWNAIETDGHDAARFSEAYAQAAGHRGEPTAILAKTVKGKGVSVFENELRFHGGRPTAEEYRTAFSELKAKIAELEG